MQLKVNASTTCLYQMSGGVEAVVRAICSQCSWNPPTPPHLHLRRGSTVTLTDACFCQHSSPPLPVFPSSLLMRRSLSSPPPCVSFLAPISGLYFSISFHPVSWRYKMSVTFLSSISHLHFFLSPPFSPLSSTSHLSAVSSRPPFATILSSLAPRLHFLSIGMPWMPEGSI